MNIWRFYAFFPQESCGPTLPQSPSILWLVHVPQPLDLVHGQFSHTCMIRAIWWWNGVLRLHYQMTVCTLSHSVICQNSSPCPILSEPLHSSLQQNHWVLDHLQYPTPLILNAISHNTVSITILTQTTPDANFCIMKQYFMNKKCVNISVHSYVHSNLTTLHLKKKLTCTQACFHEITAHELQLSLYVATASTISL